MNYFTVSRTLALINLLVLVILFADLLILPARHVQEIYDRRSTAAIPFM